MLLLGHTLIDVLDLYAFDIVAGQVAQISTATVANYINDFSLDPASNIINFIGDHSIEHNTLTEAISPVFFVV